MKLSEIIEFNPPRKLVKGKNAPFVEMAALPQNSRDISYVFQKEFNGSGTKFKNGDTLLARITPCLENGKTAKVNCLHANEIAHGSTEFIVMQAKEPEFDEDFIYYLCRWNNFRDYAVGRMEGSSGRQRVDWRAVSEFECNLPDKDIRKRIGYSLKQFDDKIATNNKINQTLESISQTLFKSWFIDFDPVKAKIVAKEQGEDPQLAAMMAISGKSEDEINQMPADKRKQLVETADLFPDEMMDSELGEIPKGWTVKPIDEIANFLNGLALQKYPAKINDPFLPVIKIVQLKKGEVKGAEKASKDIPKEYIIDNGDVVFSWSGSLFTDVWCGGKGALNQHLFKVTSANYPKWFYYQWIILHLPEFIRIAADKAVTMGHIKREHLTQAMCIVPDEILIRKADIVFSNLLEMYINKKVESLKLAETRDILLPKLLSGELNL